MNRKKNLKKLKKKKILKKVKKKIQIEKGCESPKSKGK